MSILMLSTTLLFAGSALMIVGALRSRHSLGFSAKRLTLLGVCEVVVGFGSLVYSGDDSSPLWHSPARFLAALAALNFLIAAAVFFEGARSRMTQCSPAEADK